MVNSSGADVPLPVGAVEIISATDDTVEFTVKQLWIEDGPAELIAIQYHNGAGSLECKSELNMEHTASATQTAHCFCGFTDISIYVHLEKLDESFESCDACMLPEEGDDSSVVAYSFELACDSECSASSGPTSAPTEAPTSGPSASPTKCIDQLEPQLISSSGADVPLPAGAVDIISATDDAVEFTVKQLWIEDGPADLIAIQYHNEASSLECKTRHNMVHEASTTQTAHCFCGYTDISVYVHLEEVDQSEFEFCDACTLSASKEDDDDSVVAYYFELPCELLCEDDNGTDALSPTSAPITL